MLAELHNEHTLIFWFLAVVFGFVGVSAVALLVWAIFIDFWRSAVDTNLHDETGTPSRQLRREVNRLLRAVEK